MRAISLDLPLVPRPDHARRPLFPFESNVFRGPHISPCLVASFEARALYYPLEHSWRNPRLLPAVDSLMLWRMLRFGFEDQ
eukprot:4563453-Pleurochrysis_carterae.AAC.1